MAIDLQTASTEQLKRVIEIKEQIDALNAQLNQIMGGEIASPGPAAAPKRRGRPPGKRYFSPAARQAMADAARKRWAAQKKGNGAPKAKGKRTMSPAARAKIAAAQRARWAKQKGGASPAKAEKPAAKKKVNPKLLENLAKARAVRLAKLKAAKES